MWQKSHVHMVKAMPELKDIKENQKLAQWMVVKCPNTSIHNFTQLIDVCIRILERNDHRH